MMSKADKTFVKILIFLTIAAFIAACVGYTIYIILEVQEGRRVKSTYGEQIAGMCMSPNGGDANKNNLPTGTNLKVLVLETGKQTRHDWHGELPDDLRADSKEDLSIVVCAKEVDETLGTCHYTGGGDIEIDRIREHYVIVLLNAQTGNRIAQTVIYGEEPSCPYRASSSGTVTGDGVTYEEFFSALKKMLKM